jgi:hypothetical protein
VVSFAVADAASNISGASAAGNSRLFRIHSKETTGSLSGHLISKASMVLDEGLGCTILIGPS